MISFTCFNLLLPPPHLRYLIHIPVLIVGRPFSHLFTIFEVTGTQFRASFRNHSQ